MAQYAEKATGRAADSAANTARDSAAEARSEYYTAEEMAEFAKPKKKKVRSGACSCRGPSCWVCLRTAAPMQFLVLAEGCCNRVCSSASV